MEQQKTWNEDWKGMTLIGSKKEWIGKMISNINKIELVDIITVPKTKEEIKALNKFLNNYTAEEAAQQVFDGFSFIIKTMNEINEEIQRYLTRDAEKMKADTMPVITAALGTLGSYNLGARWMKDFFPFLNTSSKAGDFLAYIWQFFQNIKEIIGTLYDNRSIKVTEYKKTGYDARHNWQKFTDARDLATETTETVNEFANKLYETREEIKKLQR